ncbi:hypothetical protein DFH09DRAFT_1275494 [Mycena vulgaris]|nr:hypothetical protein DFH09DRAFT_1275494 [Mycena vulgaris]
MDLDVSFHLQQIREDDENDCDDQIQLAGTACAVMIFLGAEEARRQTKPDAELIANLANNCENRELDLSGSKKVLWTNPFAYRDFLSWCAGEEKEGDVLMWAWKQGQTSVAA